MNARIQTQLPALGAAIQGGFFHGVLLIDGYLFGEVTAPKAAGELFAHAWHTKYSEIKDCVSSFDGLANTMAMAKAKSPLAMAVQDLSIDGFADWYLPARGGLLLQWDARTALPKGEEFESAWYWSSTQYSRYYAFFQHFGYGHTDNTGKYWEGGRARAVRRFLIE